MELLRISSGVLKQNCGNMYHKRASISYVTLRGVDRAPIRAKKALQMCHAGGKNTFFVGVGKS